jgi:hypothetical protein
MAFWQWGRSKERKAPSMTAQALNEPILAYRVWRVGTDGLLVSCTYECTWTPRARMDAHCCIRGTLHPQAAPVWDCSCGFYAFKTPAALAASRYTELSGALTVSGRVALWGRVIDHELGYRARYAYPQVLYLRGDRSDEVVRRLADCYAIECLPSPLERRI